MVIKKRAINNLQKEKRHQKILNCGLALYNKSDYDKVSMARVAKCAGIAKGTVFLYFKTKEELFLGITHQEFESWFDDLNIILEKNDSSKTNLNMLMQAIQAGFQKHQALIRLITILHIILEHNIDYKTALSFKKMLAIRLDYTGMLLEKSIPFLRPGQGGKLLHWMYALLIGFGQMAQPAPIIQKILKTEPGMHAHQINFNDYFFDALQTILIGWQIKNTKKKR